MLEARFHPLKTWPKKQTTPSHQRRNRFRAKQSDTLDLLEFELSKLGARDIAIEGFFQAKDIRNDGWPYERARPTQPGIVLKFTTKKGESVFACDRFPDWQQNLRAIAMGLEKLRLIEDYGIVEDQQQYAGWLKLGAGDPEAIALENAKVIIEKACAQDSFTPRDLLAGRDAFERAAALALKSVHPDLNDGNDGGLQMVLAMRDGIRRLKGWA
ncbi:MAG: hypothetical protein AB7U82_27570 [Blastocatellales bacterium]